MLTVACNSITFLNSIAKLDSKIRFGGALTMASHVAQGGLGNKQGTTTHKRVGLVSHGATGRLWLRTLQVGNDTSTHSLR